MNVSSNWRFLAKSIIVKKRRKLCYDVAGLQGFEP